jgi:hypothetical protein
VLLHEGEVGAEKSSGACIEATAHRRARLPG